MTNELLKVAYHRNGVCGEGFYVAIVKTTDDDMLIGEDMLCVTFPSDDGATRTAVFKLAELDKRVIEFGMNSWRGDHWHSFMVNDAIKAHEIDMDKRLGIVRTPEPEPTLEEIRAVVPADTFKSIEAAVLKARAK